MSTGAGAGAGVDAGVGVDTDADVVRQTGADVEDSRMSAYSDDLDEASDDQMYGILASQQVAERHDYSGGDDTYASRGMGIGNPSVSMRHSSLGTDTGRVASHLSVGRQSPGRLSGNDVISTAARASEPLEWHRSEEAVLREYQSSSMDTFHGWKSNLGPPKNREVEQHHTNAPHATKRQAGYYRPDIPVINAHMPLLRTLFLRVPNNSTVSRNDIYDWFAAFGEVEGVLNFIQKGICYVMYYDSRCAQKARRQAGKHIMINGCPIGVSPSKPRPGSAERSPDREDQQATVLFTLVGENASMDESARSFFEKFGEINGFFPIENRENEWVAEYFDTRAAADAIYSCHNIGFRGGSLYTTLLWDGSVVRSAAPATAGAMQVKSHAARPMLVGSATMATTEIKTLAKEGLQQSLPKISELPFRRSHTEGAPATVDVVSRADVPAPVLTGLPQMPAMKKRATAANWIGGAESVKVIDGTSASLSRLAAPVLVPEPEPSSGLPNKSPSASDSLAANPMPLPACDQKIIPPATGPPIAGPVDMVARLMLDPSLLQKAQAAKAILQRHHLLGTPSSGHNAGQMGDAVPHNGASAGPPMVVMQQSLAGGSALESSSTPASLDRQVYRDGSQNVGPNLDKLLGSKPSLPMTSAAAMPSSGLASASGSPPYSPLTAVHPMQALPATATHSQAQSVAAPVGLAESPPQTAVEGGGDVQSEGINRLLGILAQVHKGTPSSEEAAAATAASTEMRPH
ncbi:hypothetical protein GGI15_003832 [Coemansia interrupta]|uniref:RRM domain-containing protein n=1 Tax=Coemansia interrupta TaxID=1126814 RepID=A0A9W8LFL1_9FUNG|nr:hypothetical protein GGI15_003832 [Coemansia interrupta]